MIAIARNRISRAQLQDAASVLEFGCGTGRLAKDLLSSHLPETATYIGQDLSPEMVARAKTRIAPYTDRAEIRLTEGEIRFDVADESHDRVMACYVLDLLSDTDIDLFFSEAHRVLKPGGLLCTASLTRGTSPSSKLVSQAKNLTRKIGPSNIIKP